VLFGGLRERPWLTEDAHVIADLAGTRRLRDLERRPDQQGAQSLLDRCRIGAVVGAGMRGDQQGGDQQGGGEGGCEMTDHGGWRKR